MADDRLALASGVAALAERFQLDASAATRLEQLALAVFDDPESPTSVRDPLTIIDLHLADSLSALGLPVVGDARGAVADVGSGPGFPGLALAAARPVIEVHCVESVSRKCAFLRDAIAAAGLTNAHVVCERAEAWAAGRGAMELVTVRAVDVLPVLVEYAAPLLCEGGHLVAWKGRRREDEEQAGAQVAVRLGLEPVAVVGVAPFPASRHRHLHVFRKVRPTPPGYPRRPGVARKRWGHLAASDPATGALDVGGVCPDDDCG